MDDPPLNEGQRRLKRQAHVRALGLTDEQKLLVREEIASAVREMPAGMSAEEQNGYESACNRIAKRLLNGP